MEHDSAVRNSLTLVGMQFGLHTLYFITWERKYETSLMCAYVPKEQIRVVYVCVYAHTDAHSHTYDHLNYYI